MKHTKTFALLAFAAFLLFACSKEEPTPEPQQPAISVPQIILDTDIAGDEAWAERLLNLIRASNR